MDKHKLYVKAPIYFGLASIAMLILIVVFLAVGTDELPADIAFWIGAACTIAGIISSCFEKGKSEAERKYSIIGVLLCLGMAVIYLLLFCAAISLAHAFEEIMEEIFDGLIIR